jgi:serine phosphatase RsbU (regulator of sigma subunit)
VQHAQGTRFISLWLGVFDLIERTVQYVDAGHGYWLLRPPGGEPQRVECVGGVPLGVDEDAHYRAESLVLVAGSRLIVYSDGVHEQPNPDGEEFGLERTLASLSPAEHPEADVVSLVQSVKVHAAPQLLSMSSSHRPFASGPEVNLADDVTVASILVG